MADFNIRSDSVNVEQIMEQIRARIRDKRGVDYTEQQIQDLAAVKLEKFLDPRGVRSDLLEEFRRMRPPVEPPVRPNYVFNDSTLFETHRAPIRWIRRLLLPILKLFFNPNPLIQALHIQSQLNTMQAQTEAQQLARGPARDQLTFEVMHNLVVETTRMGIEVKSLKMRVESLSSRLEFNERRARSLESAVVYKPAVEQMADRGFRTSGGSGQGSGRSERAEMRQADSRPRTEFRPQPEVTPETSAPVTPVAPPVPGGQPPAGPDGPGQRSRRRRRRRGRRSGPPAAVTMGEGSMPAAEAAPLPPADQAPASPASQQSAGPASPASDSPHGSDFGSGGSEPDSQ
jgi:hypothetical protein